MKSAEDVDNILVEVDRLHFPTGRRRRSTASSAFHHALLIPMAVQLLKTATLKQVYRLSFIAAHSRVRVPCLLYGTARWAPKIYFYFIHFETCYSCQLATKVSRIISLTWIFFSPLSSDSVYAKMFYFCFPVIEAKVFEPVHAVPENKSQSNKTVKPVVCNCVFCGNRSGNKAPTWRHFACSSKK